MVEFRLSIGVSWIIIEIEGDNRIAVACKATNVLWRRMHRQTVLVLLNRMIMNLIEEAGTNFVIRNVAFPLQDVVDVI